MSEAKPYPKSAQLGRGTKRYRRKVASPKQWQAITAAKIGPCRVCGSAASNGRVHGRITFHHIVPRDFHGDDLAENIAPLCHDCHDLVTSRDPQACKTFCASLDDYEYAYSIQKLGEQVFERVYGIEYGR
jgi:5-methylcytosine-specific restriction endonuclease McrA